MMRAIALISALLIIGVAIVVFVGYRFSHSPASDSESVVVFEVAPGQSFKVVAKNLFENNLVSDVSKFEILARVTRATGKVRVGEYAIRRNMTPREILQVVTSGKSVEHIVKIQEGLNIFEIANLLERQGLVSKREFLDLCRNQSFINSLLKDDLSSLEGYLFPETYHITKFTGARGLIKMMVDRMLGHISQVTLNPNVNLSRHEWLTLASIIEKETGAPEERPLISSVFHNRMRIGMRLQTDPTVIYGLWSARGEFSGNITRADLTTPTKFNTYTFTGLPHGPIANPGLEALKAAQYPAQSEYLFFVSRNNGTHIFSKDYAGHSRAVRAYQIDRRAREGKSWRDLQKRPGT